MPNVLNFFEFLKDVKPIPFEAKLRLGAPITEDELNYKVYLNVRDSDDVIEIPNNLYFKGGLDITNFSNGGVYFDTFAVDGELQFRGNFYGDLNNISFPNQQNRGGGNRIAFFDCGNLITIPNFNYQGTVAITKCENFRYTPDGLDVEFLYLKNLPLVTNIGSVRTSMSVNLYDCPRLTEISKNFECHWNFVLENVPNLMDLPETLHVGHYLEMKNCGIQQKYTIDELRAKLPNVKEIVYM